MKIFKFMLLVMMFMLSANAQDSAPNCSDTSKLTKDEKKVCKKIKKEEKKLKKIAESKFKLEDFNCPKKVALKDNTIANQLDSWMKSHGAAIEGRVQEGGVNGYYILGKKSVFVVTHARIGGILIPSSKHLKFNKKKGSYDLLAVEEAIEAKNGNRQPKDLGKPELNERVKEAMKYLTELDNSPSSCSMVVKGKNLVIDMSAKEAAKSRKKSSMKNGQLR